MENSQRPKSSLVGMGDFALSAVNYRKMRSIERQNDSTSSALEEIRDIQRFSMAGIISLHNEIEELSRTQWSILDHLKNMENKEEILGNLKLILVHVEEQSELIDQMHSEYPEFAAMLSMNLKNMLIESEICLSNLKMMSVEDIKWAKKVLDDVDEQYTFLHSNTNEIDINKVLMLEETLKEISDLNEKLIEIGDELERNNTLIETLGNSGRLSEHEGKLASIDEEMESIKHLQNNLSVDGVIFSEVESTVRYDTTYMNWHGRMEIFFKYIFPATLAVTLIASISIYGIDNPLILAVFLVPIIMILSFIFNESLAFQFTWFLPHKPKSQSPEYNDVAKMNDEFQTRWADLLLERKEIELDIIASESRNKEITQTHSVQDSLNQKLEHVGNELADKWRIIHHLVPKDSIDDEHRSEQIDDQTQESIHFVNRWEDLPNGKWLPNDENGIHWYLDDQGRHWYSDNGGFRIFESQ